MKRVTVLGGGTGSFVVLSGLKNYPLDLAAVVTMMDSGGSTGRLRDQLGVLPPGDLRQCLVALSNAPILWRKLFTYRFTNGDLRGHNFGNIFLSALEKVSKNYDEVVEMASYVLQTKGKVIPVTLAKTHLYIQYTSGKLLIGEGELDKEKQDTTRIISAYLQPKASANPRAVERIKTSNFIIIGPGDLYASNIAILLVNGIAEAIRQSPAKIIFNINLMTKTGQTTKYTAFDHVVDLVKYLGRKPDFVTVNTGSIPAEMIDWYRVHNEQPVVNDLKEKGFAGEIIAADVVDRQRFDQLEGDQLTRSILRHDMKKLTDLLLRILL